MVQEKAIATKPHLDITEAPQPDAKFYEVIVKFHRDGREMIETFLLANMISVTVSATENDGVLLAYCHFQGDIKTLDSKLATLRQSAMVILGDKEGKFLDFFVALRQLSRPLPRLLSSSRSRILPTFKKPEWVKGFLVALGLFIVWQGYHFLSGLISRAVNPPPASSAAANPVVSQWAPYVLPEYHQAWLEVKKKHGLSDEMMVSIFRTIKVIDKYGAGHSLRDLTIYPKAIDRGLGLIILKDVGDTDALRALHKILEGYAGQWKPLPDNPIKGSSLSLLDPTTVDDQIVLTFYQHILERPRTEFTERLIQELRRTHLSAP